MKNDFIKNWYITIDKPRIEAIRKLLAWHLLIIVNKDGSLVVGYTENQATRT